VLDEGELAGAEAALAELLGDVADREALRLPDVAQVAGQTHYSVAV
jgi:hypothetical protein